MAAGIIVEREQGQHESSRTSCGQIADPPVPIRRITGAGLQVRLSADDRAAPEPTVGEFAAVPYQRDRCFMRSVAITSCSRMPGSIAEWPASGTITYSASGQARASSSALPTGHTMS